MLPDILQIRQDAWALRALHVSLNNNPPRELSANAWKGTTAL